MGFLKKYGLFMVIGVVALLVFGVIKLPSGSGNTLSGVSLPNQQQQAADNIACDSIGLNAFTMYVGVKNSENASTQYMGPTVQFGTTGDIMNEGVTAVGGSQALTAAASRSLTTWSTAPPCATGNLYVLSDTSTVGKVVGPLSTSKSGTIDVTDGQQSTSLKFAVYTTTLANDNASTDATDAQNSPNINTTTHAMTTGDSLTGYIDAQLITTSSAFGNKDDGYIVAARSSNLGAIQAADISFGSSMVSVTPMAACPNDIRTYDVGDKCWKVGQFNGMTPTPTRFQYTIRASIGNPGTDSVKFVFNDYAVFVDSDSKIHKKMYDGGGVDKGATKGVVAVRLS